MVVAELETTLMSLAQDCAQRGPGYAQEGVVLSEIVNKVEPKSLEEQQQILQVWHKLFAEGKLVWGYDLSNPSIPFFHIPSSG